jgi:hypothetical protein
MVVSSATFISDVLGFIKSDLSNNVTDPIVGSRDTKSKWVMTSYPQREVQYPLITIKLINQSANRSGMQTEAMDLEATIEVRVWARNQKEKDTIANSVYKRLRDIQFTASETNNLHDFRLNSMVEIDEAGEGTPKSRVINIRYKFYDV